MKTKIKIVLGILALLMTQGFGQTIPKEPQGSLSAYPTMVQTGTKPTLTWVINYPSTTNNFVNLSQSKIVLSAQLDVDVRVIGVGITAGGKSVATQALISYGNTQYKSIFLGTNDDVKPNDLVFSKRLNKDTEILFGGCYFFDGQWSQTYNSSSRNIRVLKNGEYPPLAYNLGTTKEIKSFMVPYLDGGGKIKIGPLDLIVMMELTQPESNAGDKNYNLQDMVLLVTCRPKNNNGHGNNIDGVDASNKGKAPFIQFDTDAKIDDEK